MDVYFKFKAKECYIKNNRIAKYFKIYVLDIKNKIYLCCH